ncbi:MAG: anaerobic ribonucleoside-triphosphate reductase activating protein [Clostridia bacterium]|nr:anaerobic ribonucleoside-triphosphate reductase activating protein [Clostridia bacterium]
MNIQGFQKLTLLDYPGRVACTVFTGGCNLRCPFCHNFQLATGEDMGPNLTDEVLEYLSKRRGIIDGVCITGGEPLLWKDLEGFIDNVKDMGYLVKLDTNGTFPDRLLNLLQNGKLDYVAMDIKSSISSYEKLSGIGVDTSAVKKSVEILKNAGIPYEFRTTTVKGLHEMNDFEEIAEWLQGDSRYYLQKFVMNETVPGKELDTFSDQEMKNILKTVKAKLPNTEIRG